MEALGVGSLPVCDGNRLVGTITDRDIVVRAVAAGLSPVDTLVRDCMTDDIVYAFCDEEADEVLERMKTLQIRRLAVLDRDKSLMGIVSLGDVATEPRAAALASVVPRWRRFPSRRVRGSSANRTTAARSSHRDGDRSRR